MFGNEHRDSHCLKWVLFQANDGEYPQAVKHSYGIERMMFQAWKSLLVAGLVGEISYHFLLDYYLVSSSVNT